VKTSASRRLRRRQWRRRGDWFYELSRE